jgi:hypothetical protein
MTEVANDRSNTIIFPLPMDMIGAFMPKPGSKGGSAGS